MDVKINPINFSCRMRTVQMKPRSRFVSWFYQRCSYKDTFIRTTFNIDKDLKKVQLKERINFGRHADVYSTNFDGYVVRLIYGTKFNAKLLKKVNDPNGLVLAADSKNNIQLMKFVKGEPLYGNRWIGDNPISKKKYFREFKKIINLPDETFAEYIRNIMQIRENGYNIDNINPNNFLLDGEHIGVVDLEAYSNPRPYLSLDDFDPLVNKNRLTRIMQTMTPKELHYFAGEIRKFYDRLINIANSEGYPISIPKTNDNGNAYRTHIINYLYYENWAMINKLTGREK